MLLWGGHYTRNISERCYYSAHYVVTLKVLAKMPSRRLCAVLLLFLLLCFVTLLHFGSVDSTLTFEYLYTLIMRKPTVVMICEKSQDVRTLCCSPISLFIQGPLWLLLFSIVSVKSQDSQIWGTLWGCLLDGLVFVRSGTATTKLNRTVCALLVI